MSKLVNNFDLIASLLSFDSEDVFYFGQIIQRRKDLVKLGYPAEKVGADNQVIKDLYFKSLDEYRAKQDTIIKMCHCLDARAYIHLNKRSKKRTAFELLSIVTDRLQRGEYQSLRSSYATACGQRHADSNKKWVVDIDFNNLMTEDEKNARVMEVSIDLHGIKPVGDKVIATVPTLNGVHLITIPFNTKVFEDIMAFKGEKYRVDLHKSNPTILYCNI